MVVYIIIIIKYQIHQHHLINQKKKLNSLNQLKHHIQIVHINVTKNKNNNNHHQHQQMMTMIIIIIHHILMIIISIILVYHQVLILINYLMKVHIVNYVKHIQLIQHL